MSRIVLLDLEETVIDNWNDGNLMQAEIAKIKSFLRPSDRLGIFSWAVWNEKDVAKFVQRFEPPLTQVLHHQFEIGLCFSMTQVSNEILRCRGKMISLEDMFDLFGKQECLLALLRGNYFPEGTEVILIDDVVEHNMTFTKDFNRIRFINVKQPRDRW